MSSGLPYWQILRSIPREIENIQCNIFLRPKIISRGILFVMWFSKRSFFAKATRGKRIYLALASSPPVLREASRAMREAEKFIGNPGAIHSEGVAAKKYLEESRARIARALGCKARELIFTSGLSESNNLAIIGYAKALERLRRSLSGT